MAGTYEYLTVGGVELFTAVITPDGAKKSPTVIIRTPYVDELEDLSEEDIVSKYSKEYQKWTEGGYNIVIQHCRGRGKSGGDCVPYINEREDGLALQQHIRSCSFYNGELFLKGASYLTSVHYATAPFSDDICGAVFSVQDCERYNLCYRNGFFKSALHGTWYVGMYKAKSKLKKNYTDKSFDTLPLSDFSQTVFGESAQDLDEMLKHPNREDAFWNTRYGGADARGAVKDVKFPVLFTTGFYDIYTGGIFDMWNGMESDSRNRCALVVSPYDHSDRCRENSIAFPNGKRTENFGEDYEIEWFDYIRGLRAKPPFEQGKVTYYRLFENRWCTDDFETPQNRLEIPLGSSDVSYVYNPYNPPEFNGGLSCNFGGAQYQQKAGSRYDIVSIYSEPFENDVFVKGKMSAKLCVKSDCEDTCFYVRISITKEGGDYGLRDDITSLCFQRGDYVPNSEVMLDFSFDEHAFLIKRGEKIRIDIASADSAHYVRHTNNKGLFSEQKTAKIAHNTVVLSKSSLILTVE